MLLSECTKAVLFQDPSHFHFSIRQNVTMPWYSVDGGMTFERDANLFGQALRAVFCQPCIISLDHHPHQRLGAAGADQHPATATELGLDRLDPVAPCRQ